MPKPYVSLKEWRGIHAFSGENVLKSLDTFVCAQRKLSQKGEFLEWEFDGVRYSANRCGKCGHVFFDPPDTVALNDYLENRYSKVHAAWHNTDADYTPGQWAETGEYLLSRFAEFDLPDVTLHQVDCGFGGLVNWFQRRGIDATGCGYNSGEVNAGRERGNRRIFMDGEAQLESVRTSPPSAVISIHKLQRHISPGKAMSEIVSYMGDHTLGFIIVPNAMYLRALREGYWKYNWFSFPDNLHYFTASSAMCLADKVGLSVVDASCTGREDDRQALGSALTALRGGSPPDDATARDIIQRRMLGRELCLVVCRRGSSAYKRYEPRIKALTSRQVETQRREDEIMQLLGAVA